MDRGGIGVKVGVRDGGGQTCVNKCRTWLCIKSDQPGRTLKTI